MSQHDDCDDTCQAKIIEQQLNNLSPEGRKRMNVFIDMSDILKRCPECKGIYDIDKPHKHTRGTDLLTVSPEATTPAVKGAITEVGAPPKDATGADTTK